MLLGYVLGDELGPHSILVVVWHPLELTDPLIDAEVSVIDVAAFVVTVGFAQAGAVLKGTADPVAFLPSELIADRRK